MASHVATTESSRAEFLPDPVMDDVHRQLETAIRAMHETQIVIRDYAAEARNDQNRWRNIFDRCDAVLDRLGVALRTLDGAIPGGCPSGRSMPDS